MPPETPSSAGSTGGDARLVWPKSSDVQRAVGERLHLLLEELPEPLRSLGLDGLTGPHQLLGPEPHAPTPVLVVGVALSAGAPAAHAYWPAASMELLLRAADVLDDLADADQPSFGGLSAGAALTAAAGLVAVAVAAVGRCVEDGVASDVAVALSRAYGDRFAEAAAGQARSLEQRSVSALEAYGTAAGKSGPLGALAGELGARLGTEDAELLDLYVAFGRHFAVWSQLLNDVRDAAPEAQGKKADVRTAEPTVPVTFAGIHRLPEGMSGTEAEEWERRQRERIQASGGLAAGLALAEAERLRALQALDSLEGRGRPVAGLRALT